MIKFGSEQGLSMRRALVLFATFVQREQDISVASVLFICLQSISFLPVAYIHSTLVVNYAYASSLRIVRNRHKLVHALHASGWLQTSFRLFGWLQRSVWSCVFPVCTLKWLRPKQVQQADADFRVFLPTSKMPDNLNEKGPAAIAHQWADMGAVKERTEMVSALTQAGSSRLSAAEMPPPQVSSSSEAGDMARSDLYGELNSQLKNAYKAMKPRLDGRRAPIELDDQNDAIAKDEMCVAVSMK